MLRSRSIVVMKRKWLLSPAVVFVRLQALLLFITELGPEMASAAGHPHRVTGVNRLDDSNELVSCPLRVGHLTGSHQPSSRSFSPLESSNSMTHLLLNASFPCRGRIRSWTYFRSRDSPKIFASVWRKEPMPDDYFRLVGINILPAGDVGLHRIVIVSAKDRIVVERGDFIGFHYSGADVYRFNEPGAVLVDTPAHGETAADGRRYYLTLTAGYYNENFHVDMPQTFHTSDRRLTMSSPTLQAELEYTDSRGRSSAESCDDQTATVVACSIPNTKMAFSAPGVVVPDEPADFISIRSSVHRLPTNLPCGDDRLQSVTEPTASDGAFRYWHNGIGSRNHHAGCLNDVTWNVAGICSGRTECTVQLSDVVLDVRQVNFKNKRGATKSGASSSSTVPCHGGRGEFLDVGYDCVLRGAVTYGRDTFVKKTHTPKSSPSTVSGAKGVPKVPSPSRTRANLSVSPTRQDRPTKSLSVPPNDVMRRPLYISQTAKSVTDQVVAARIDARLHPVAAAIAIGSPESISLSTVPMIFAGVDDVQSKRIYRTTTSKPEPVTNDVTTDVSIDRIVPDYVSGNVSGRGVSQTEPINVIIDVSNRQIMPDYVIDDLWDRDMSSPAPPNEVIASVFNHNPLLDDIKVAISGRETPPDEFLEKSTVRVMSSPSPAYNDVKTNASNQETRSNDIVSMPSAVVVRSNEVPVRSNDIVSTPSVVAVQSNEVPVRSNDTVSTPLAVPVMTISNTSMTYPATHQVVIDVRTTEKPHDLTTSFAFADVFVLSSTYYYSTSISTSSLPSSSTTSTSTTTIETTTIELEEGMKQDQPFMFSLAGVVVGVISFSLLATTVILCGICFTKRRHGKTADASIVQSRVIEDQLKINPIYGHTTQQPSDLQSHHGTVERGDTMSAATVAGLAATPNGGGMVYNDCSDVSDGEFRSHPHQQYYLHQPPPRRHQQHQHHHRHLHNGSAQHNHHLYEKLDTGAPLAQTTPKPPSRTQTTATTTTANVVDNANASSSGQLPAIYAVLNLTPTSSAMRRPKSSDPSSSSAMRVTQLPHDFGAGTGRSFGTARNGNPSGTPSDFRPILLIGSSPFQPAMNATSQRWIQDDTRHRLATDASDMSPEILRIRRTSGSNRASGATDGHRLPMPLDVTSAPYLVRHDGEPQCFYRQSIRNGTSTSVASSQSGDTTAHCNEHIRSCFTTKDPRSSRILVSDSNVLTLPGLPRPTISGSGYETMTSGMSAVRRAAAATGSDNCDHPLRPPLRRSNMKFTSYNNGLPDHSTEMDSSNL